MERQTFLAKILELQWARIPIARIQEASFEQSIEVADRGPGVIGTAPGADLLYQ